MNKINIVSKLFITNVSDLNNDRIFEEKFKTLSTFRQEKIMRCHFRKDKNLSLAAGLLVDNGLQEYGLREKDMEYCRGENGKPYFYNFPNIHFNISHSGNVVICLFSENDVGCDIEKTGKINLKIAEKFFFNTEYEYIINQKTEHLQADAFFRLWSLKESFIKITGKGIALGLSSFSINFENGIQVKQSLDKRNYYFKEYFYDGYKVACCSVENNLPENFSFIQI